MATCSFVGSPPGRGSAHVAEVRETRTAPAGSAASPAFAKRIVAVPRASS